MRVLILEDEPKVASFLCQALNSEGHQTLWLTSLEELDSITPFSHPIDLAIFDRMLGLKDSIKVIPEFKKKYSSCALLVLSAINTPEERAHALDMGADDYVGKPYSLLELLARLRAIKRRENLASGNQSEKTLFKIGDLTLDQLNHKIFYGGKRIDFSAKEFNFLSLLMRRPGQVFNKCQILDQVWDTQLDLESNVVEATIRNIRRKLEEASVTIKIQGKRNVGYWIEE